MTIDRVLRRAWQSRRWHPGIADGGPLARFLFVTPSGSRTRGSGTTSAIALAHPILVNLARIDEAHTVSEWGHDFSDVLSCGWPEVSRLWRRPHGGWPPVLTLTGTGAGRHVA